MKYLTLLLLVELFSSCNDMQKREDKKATASSNSSATTSNSEPSYATGIDGCYMKVTGRDTAILMLAKKGNDLQGKMIYDNYQKDGSSGTIKGKQEGNILKLFYDFNSEGMRSVMEVYFKIAPGGLLRGMGSMDVKSDTTYFISGINYSDLEVFSRVDCELVKNKFEY
jgi:hypothetical protein